MNELSIQQNQTLWEEMFKNKEWGKYPSEPLIRFIAKHFYKVPNRKDIKILELGIGGGANIWYMAREGFSVSGIEWAQNGINQCIRRFESEGLMPYLDSMQCGDYLYALDNFKPQSFDAWIDSASLCCNDFEKTQKIIHKTIEKLKIGGKFFSLTPSVGTFGLDEDKDLGYHLCKPTQGCCANTGIVRFSTKEDIETLYNGANYHITHSYEVQTLDEGTLLNGLFIIEGLKRGE
ncbi:class I SAM-dependent methyltransferase [Helicobacter mastomyrinus]|uniref:Class I SAM-dependent methyltransferase n=1 Tax=Helicobacter mastomyrinus TaxID=287948 RepID=A0ABZ3F7L1_9HELI